MRFVLIAELAALVGLHAYWIAVGIRTRRQPNVKRATISIIALLNLLL